MDYQVESTTAKKPFYKKWWFFVIIGVLLIALIFGTNDSNNSSENTVGNSVAGTSDDTDSATDNDSQEKNLTFELVAGQQGEYGKMITYNKGTEFEENFYAFYIPAGTYVVTNTGKYRDQLNVYSDEISTANGYEEPADGFCKLLDVNASVTVTIEEGQHIEIIEPSTFKFEKQE